MHSKYCFEFDDDKSSSKEDNVLYNEIDVNPNWYRAKESTGTTILAFEFNGGVMFAADTRTSSGAYVGNRFADKLDPITDRIIACRSGASADTQAILNIVRYHLNFYEMEIGERPTVKVAANIFRQLVYDYRDQLVAGIICAGWDKKNGGQVYLISLGGMLSNHKIAFTGSGSTYIYGYLDSNFKPGLSQDEARKLAINAISLAIARDGSSGGCCRLAIVNEHGIQRENIEGDDLPFFDKK